MREFAVKSALAQVGYADCAGDCAAPIEVALTGQVDAVHSITGVIAPLPTKDRATIWVRCRQCEQCRKAKRNMWAARALAEQALAAETVFLTLTLGPDARMALLVHEAQAPRRPDVDRNDASRVFLAHRWITAEVQKFWKRLRKSKLRFRYFAAVEHHKDGTPHVHAMLFFNEPSLEWSKCPKGFPKANQLFANAWGHGFTNTWRVDRTDNRRAFYVAKYVAKGNTGRLAASQRLGQGLQVLGRRTAKPVQPSPL